MNRAAATFKLRKRGLATLNVAVLIFNAKPTCGMSLSVIGMRLVNAHCNRGILSDISLDFI